MSVITLYHASFYTIIRQKWKNTWLRKLIIDENYAFFLTNSILTREQAIESTYQKRQKVKQYLINICNQFLASGLLTRTINNDLASNFYEMVLEIDDFLGSMVKEFKRMDKRNINYFLKRVVITQKGTIDTKKSIINIIQDSKFCFKFSNKFLLIYCIEKEDLNQLSETVLARLEDRSNQSRQPIEKIKDNVNRSLKIMLLPTVDKFLCFQILYKYPKNNYIKVLLYGRNLNQIKHMYNKLESPIEKHEFLLTISHYAFKEKLLFNAWFAVFLYENFNEVSWKDIQRRYFNEAFCILLTSSRCRRYMLPWFRQAIGSMSCDIYIKLISDEAWSSPSLASHEITAMHELFTTIWDETPETFKQEHLVRQAVVKTTVYVIQNVQVLEHVLRHYNKSIQRQMLRQANMHFGTNRTDDDHTEINKYVKDMSRIAANLGLPTNTYLSGHTADLMYYVLAIDGTKAYHVGKEEHANAYYFGRHSCGYEINLLKDKLFIEQFLTRHWLTENNLAIFLWCTNKNIKTCNNYFLRLNDKIFERVYEKVLYQEGDLAIGNQGFTSLKISKQQVRRVKLNVLSKPEVRKHLLSNYFRRGSFDFVKQWQVCYDHIADGIAGFFREVFTAEYGKEALWQLILYIEGSTSLLQQIEYVEVYSIFCDKIVYKHGLGVLITDGLLADGHPNMRNAPIKYQDREPTEQELPELRKVVDFRYRSLLALVNGSSSSILRDRRCETLTAVSLALAHYVGLNIPVVL